jgi:O-antigen biosynthesis protein
MAQKLKQIFMNHSGKLSDKWSLYINEWDKILSPYQDQEIDLLEIGIQNGGSLEIWSKYFKNAKHIIGCDIDPKCECLDYSDERINLILGNINSETTENDILKISNNFDIIIDDGSHISSDIIQSFNRYFPHLKDSGVFIIEDIHTSYWKHFEGGLFYPYSTTSYLKRLVDIINYEHWRLPGFPRKHILKNFENKYKFTVDEKQLLRIHSIEFINSLCIIKKNEPDKNVLGKRIVTGNEECVTNDYQLFHGTQIQDTSPMVEDDRQFDVFRLIENQHHQDEVIQQLNADLAEREQSIQQLNADLAEREQSIQQLTADLAEREQEVLFYVLSKSWRITRPLRQFRRSFRGKKHA